jgi:hypothetical protein
MTRIIFVPKTRSKIIKQRVRNYFIKMSFRKYFRIIFLAEKIGFKRNYLKRRGQGSSATGWHDGKNGSRRWAGVERGDEMKKKSRLAIENLDQKS